MSWEHEDELRARLQAENIEKIRKDCTQYTIALQREGLGQYSSLLRVFFGNFHHQVADIITILSAIANKTDYRH